MAKSQIKNYTFKPGIGALDYVYPNAYDLLNRNRSFLLAEATAWIYTQVAANVTGFIGYTFNEVKCQRDLGYVLDAYLHDLRYGGNEQTRKIIGYYWEQDVAQVDGDRIPEIQTHGYIGDLITDYIFTNTAATQLGAVSQVIDITKTSETAATTKIDQLVTNTVSVITNGLSSLPVLVPNGAGTIKIQGKHPSSSILLITNTTKNEIIYNFSNPETGGIFTIKDHGEDAEFPSYLQTTDGVTTIELNYNTSLHSSTDDIQIFVEEKEVRTRPYDFGTDAIERHRVALSQSMLDADFEYGLQPTKWSAIGTLRGYPSVYEVPGTDTGVLSISTDASTGTSGVGQSLITVTTVAAHGFPVGSPVTIKALANSISGAARAEGSFVINTVPTTNTFTYFAKAKVGTSNGQILSTTYSQLRQAGFYTGASVGSPAFTISSQGSSGTMFAQLNIATGSTIIPFDGPAPQIGSPLTNAGIPLGSQVTGIIDTSAGGGTYITPAITDTALAGTNRVYLDSTAGIVDNLAVDRGNGTAIYVNNVQPTYIEFDGNLTSNLIPNKKIYTDVLGVNQNPAGTGASFNVTLTGNPSRNYTVAINNAGTGYAVGNRIKIDGITLGGQSGSNDLNISVSTVGASGNITGITFTGAHWDGSLALTGVTAQNLGGAGTGARFDLYYTGGAYSSVVPATGIVAYVTPAGTGSGVGVGVRYTVTRTGTSYSVAINSAGTGYAISDTIIIPGTALGGAAPANNATITINTVGAGGTVLTASITGTALNTADASTGYLLNDVIKILGSTIGGLDVFNDVYLKVSSVSGSTITGVTYSGTPPTVNNTYNGIGSASNPYTYSGSTGSGAAFSITNSNGAYAVAIVNAGADYAPTETFIVAGTLLGGTSPANNATITVDNVGGLGDITNVSITGTGSTAGNKRDITGTNRTGTGASFNVSISGASYTATINSAGTNYGAGQQLVIRGNLLSGATPTNDLIITITAVDALITGVITAVTRSGTPATTGGPYTAVSGNNIFTVGDGAIFNVSKNFRIYDAVTVGSNAGLGYNIGDRILVLGDSMDGTASVNDITLTVTAVGAGGTVETVSYIYTAANPGSNFDLISTVLMSEASTDLIALNSLITYAALATLEITFSTPHGFVPGDSFIITISSDAGGNNHALAAGSFFATEIPTLYKLRYTARSAGAINVGSQAISGIVYPRPDSFFTHRPFDGGVQLGTGGPQHGAQAIRQSKKYIRYQSGKGIMYTTGALFAPSYDLRSVTSDGIEVGSLITVETDDNDHGVQVGGVIRLLGISTPGYNSGTERASPPDFDYTVVDVLDERRFRVRSQRRLGNTTATLGFAAQMSVVAWHGATVRSGIFDDQNGIFWEYDGTNLSVNQRTGTKQIAGTIAMTVDQNGVAGTNTRFRDQVKAGDRIVIKGMTHVVTNVFDNTTMSVAPDWRGVVNITGAKANLVLDKKVKQEEFNLDRLDGTGPSGYKIDIAKMQMIGIQYTWYGAGFIDFMLRGSDGNFVFAHRMRNSNVNTEAFMRSGNLPVRYEVTNEGPPGRLAATMTAIQTTITLEDASFFPDNGTVYIDNEVIRFTAKSGNTLTNCIRNSSLNNFQAGADRIYQAGPADIHASGTGVVLISNTITPLISHWGSAFLTDGGFDTDRGYIFSYSETAVNVSTTKKTAFMIRLAPSVSNAIVGDLGERELLNRAQLLLQGLEITSDGVDGANVLIKGGIVIEGVLNPQNYPLNPGSVGWSGLSGVAQGGQPSFAQIAAGGAIEWSSGAAATTANATSIAALTAVLDSGMNPTGNNSQYVFVNATDYRNTFGSADVNQVVGKIITGTGVPSNTTITSAYIPTNTADAYGYFFLSNRTNASIAANQADRFTITYNAALVNRNFAYLTKSSFDSAGAKVGTQVSAGSGLTIPANTQVNRITLITWAGTQFYEVQFNNSYTGTLATSSGTITFRFIQPPYAQPGETVFSFIANPGERSTLDLAQLKELTNTALGGRGTFPNGPDVLAINVYKVSGAETTSNITVRWGEAQA